MEVVPHLAPAISPLLFATLQFAAMPNCRMVPTAPGLGIDATEPELRLVEVA